jgi:hypothetical protein
MSNCPGVTIRRRLHLLPAGYHSCPELCSCVRILQMWLMSTLTHNLRSYDLTIPARVSYRAAEVPNSGGNQGRIVP